MFEDSMNSTMNPTISLPISCIPQAKNWKVGETYKLELEVEQVSVSKNSVTFEVKEAEPLDEPDEREPMASDSGMYMGK